MQLFVCFGQECDFFEEGPFEIKSRQKIGDIIVNDIMEIEFDLQYNTVCTSTWCQIFQIGRSSNRFPIMSMEPREGNELIVAYGVDGKEKAQYRSTDPLWLNIIGSGDYHHIYIKVSQDAITVRIDGHDLWHFEDVTHPDFPDLLYRSHPIYVHYPTGINNMDANIKNFCVNSIRRDGGKCFYMWGNPAIISGLMFSFFCMFRTRICV